MNEIPLYSEAIYHTNANISRYPFLSVMPCKSLFFHARYMLGAFLKARRLAVKGMYDAEALRESSEAYARQIELIGGEIHVDGLDNLDSFDGAAVIVGNHMSLIETFLLPAMILAHKPLTFVVKKTLVEQPVFGPIMRSLNPIAVTRDNPRQDLKTVMTEGREHLQAGRCMCVFPQTTRSASFDPDKFNTIGVKLAAKAGVPVVPLALKTDFMLNGRLVKDLGMIHPERPIHFAFGPPMMIEKTGGARAAQRRVIEFIQSHLDAWN